MRPDNILLTHDYEPLVWSIFSFLEPIVQSFLNMISLSLQMRAADKLWSHKRPISGYGSFFRNQGAKDVWLLSTGVWRDCETFKQDGCLFFWSSSPTADYWPKDFKWYQWEKLIGMGNLIMIIFYTSIKLAYAKSHLCVFPSLLMLKIGKATFKGKKLPWFSGSCTGRLSWSSATLLDGSDYRKMSQHKSVSKILDWPGIYMY